jgi:transcriptional regulator with XRE-family HTH domain
MMVAQQVGRNIRRLRETTGRSLADVAESAGLSRTTLHGIEQGEANPTLSTLWALASALSVPLGRLLTGSDPSGTIVRADEGPTVSGESVHARLLHRVNAPGWLEVYEIDVDEHRQRSEPHLPGVEECLIVTAGEIETGPADSPTHLTPGDSIHFDGAQPHIYHGVGEHNRAILLMIHR